MSSSLVTPPRVTPGIQLPQDQYLHVGAPTEWWWHTGTLQAGSRLFGFEINATGVAQPDGGLPPFAFTQIMIGDVANQVSYQKSTIQAWSANWAEANPKKPWYARLGGAIGTSGAVSMQAPASNPLAMAVQATFNDTTTKQACALTLDLVQNGAPLLVWGTGVKEVNPAGRTPLTRNNFYYSLTRLQANGVLQIGSESVRVTGTTWMDHEYGFFPGSTKWTLQDMQLDNGVHLSNYTAPNTQPVENQPMPSNVTVLTPDGRSTFYDSVTTPLAPTWTSPEGIVYCLRMKVEIAAIKASLLVTSLIPAQEFTGQGMAIYEGIAHAEGSIQGTTVAGTAWLEQNLGK